MKKMIVCGKENLNGKLMIAPLDEKNVTTDWIEDFLFEGNCVNAAEDSDRYCGFFSLANYEVLCNVYCSVEDVYYSFPCDEELSIYQVEDFCKQAAEFFAENDFSIQITATEKDNGAFYPSITVCFYAREEE